MSRDEWEDSDQSFYGTCDQCHTSGVLVILSDDPYLSEMEPEAENPEEYWCRPCWNQRCADR